MKFVNCFSNLALLNLDPDPGTPMNPGPIRIRIWINNKFVFITKAK